MPFQDLTELFKKYQNLWVALDDDKNVISSASTLEEVLKLAIQEGFLEPTTAFIPDFNTEFVL